MLTPIDNLFVTTPKGRTVRVQISRCENCGANVHGTFRKPRFCQPCNTARTQEQRRIRTLSSEPTPFECKACGTTFLRKPKAARLCKKCHNEYRNEWQRKKRGNVTRVGETFACADCSLPTVRTHGNKRLCKPCALKRTPGYFKEAKRRAAERRPIITITCVRCSEIIGTSRTRQSMRQRCDKCRIVVRNEKQNERRRSIPAAGINHRIRAAIAQSLEMGKQGHRWEALVGYTLEDLMRHLERQFKGRMSWKNRSKWHIDHIVPLNAFQKFQTPADPDFKAAWALTNLRPMWAAKNISKHAKRTHLI